MAKCGLCWFIAYELQEAPSDGAAVWLGVRIRHLVKSHGWPLALVF